MLFTHAHELYSRENQMRRQRVSTKLRAHTFHTLTTTLSRRVVMGVFCGKVGGRETQPRIYSAIGVGTTGAPGAGAPLDLAILYGECLIEIVKCVI